jgi:hypothetical protein
LNSCFCIPAYFPDVPNDGNTRLEVDYRKRLSLVNYLFEHPEDILIE